MIAAKQVGSGARFAARLADKARQLAEAKAEERVRARRGEARRWRLARLLWPVFTKGR